MEASVAEIMRRRESMDREHAAWLDTCIELRRLGIDINQQDPLANAMRKWGEELHQLRLADPRYDETALTEKREAYPGQYESGEYPKALPA